jgi:YggT family protein
LKAFTPQGVEAFLANHAKMPHKQVFSVPYRGFFMSVSNAFFVAILEVVYVVLDFYIWALIVGAVLSWLVAFGVVNPYNRVVHVVGDFLVRITEPLLAPIRRALPNMGNLDLSPLVLIFVIYFLKAFIRNLVL